MSARAKKPSVPSGRKTSVAAAADPSSTRDAGQNWASVRRQSTTTRRAPLFFSTKNTPTRPRQRADGRTSP
eukprot:6431937-Lingulodinium_polyedra.AAC.1